LGDPKGKGEREVKKREEAEESNTGRCREPASMANSD